MPVEEHITVLPVNDAPGSGWGHTMLQRLVNPSPASIPPGERSSIADFFADCTLGEVRLSGRVAKQTVLPADDPHWTTVRTGTGLDDSKRPALAALITRCRLAGADFAPDDILLVVGSLATDRAFATRVRIGDRLHRAAYVSTETVLDATGNPDHSRICHHRTMVHEVGHTLGFAHPYGLVHEEFDRATTEYGSPYCVMGGAARQWEVCTSLTPWPLVLSAPQFAVAGPRLSMAELYAWHVRRSPLSPVTGPWLDRVDLDESGITSFSIADQDGPADTPRLVLASTPRRQVLAFEVRRPLTGRAVDWDAGLNLRRDPGLDLGLAFDRPVPGHVPERDLHDGPAVVVHWIGSVLDPEAETQDFETGDAWLPARPVYLGAIPLPLSGDTDISWREGSHWWFRAVSEDAGRVRVQVGTAPQAAAKRVIVRSLAATTAETGRVIAGPFEVDGVGQDCGVRGYFAFRVDHRRELLLQASSTGLEAPSFRWTVGDHDLGWHGLGVGVVRDLVVPLPVDVPDGYRRSARATHAALVRARVGWDQIRLTVRGVPGTADLPVTCAVRGAGHTVESARTAHQVRVVGQSLEFPAALAEDLHECTGKFLRALEDLRERFPDLVHGAVLDDHGVRVPPTDWGMQEWRRVLGDMSTAPGLDSAERRRLTELAQGIR